MTVARTRWWLLVTVLAAAACSSPSAQPPLATAPVETTPPPTTSPAPATVESTSPTSTSILPPAVTLVPVDPAVLTPLAVGNEPFPATADELVTERNGYTGDPNAVLQQWSITPMAVPSGPDVRLLGFERTVGINTTTAVFLTGPLDADASLAAIQSLLAPAATYAVTPSTRTEGTATIHGFDAQPTTVQGEPPGWTVEVGLVDQLGVVRVKRSDYTFAKTAPSFADLPETLRPTVAYENGVTTFGGPLIHRTRLGYELKADRAGAQAALAKYLTTGWDVREEAGALYFTSATTSEVWTLDSFGGATRLTYDTGS
jgi:hypothetical protein